MAINNPFKPTSFHQPSRNYSKVRYFVLITLLLFLMMSISGCVTLADPEASQEYTSDTVGVLDVQTSLGQSFVSRRPNLNGITIWMTTSSGQTNESTSDISNHINVKLYLDPRESSPVFATTIITPASVNSTPITISIPDQKNPGGQNYYLQLTKDSGAIQINGRNEDAYPLGQAYLNEKAINADIAFRLCYNYDFLALVQDIKQSTGYLWIVAPLLVILWLPGWLLLDLSGFRSRFDFGEQTAISTGLSLALIPVVMLWTTILKIKWTSGGVFFATGFLLAICIARLVYIGFTSHRNLPKLDSSPSQSQTILPTRIFKFLTSKSFALILIFLVSLAVRLIMVRDLATPAWVDSVHHALITRLILNYGSYPATYMPFWDINPTAYHPGFHSIAAAFTWLSNLDLAQSLLILGQVLNAFSIFSVYLFTTSLTRSSTAGLFAAIITGFLTPMPAYYTSWGRYTELTGLLLLPVVLTLIQLCMDENAPRRRGWIIVLGGITAGGLFMIHYRVIVFLACLIFSYLIFYIVRKREDLQVKPGRLLAYVLAIVVLGIASVFPWFLHTLKSTVLPIVNTPITTSVLFFQDFSWPYLTSALGKQSLVLAGLGLLRGMIKHRRFTFILIVWILILFFLGNMAALKLPGGGLISTSSVEIMLFIPISILGGYFIDQILINWKDLIPKQFIRPSLGIILILSGFVAFLGAKQLVSIINPITILSRTADLPAIKWLGDHIPENETIVINPFAWGYGLYGGSDGGFWISPLSGRVTLPPPVLYGLGGEAKKIIQHSQQVISLSPDPSALWEYLNSQQLHYIYIGAKGGVIPPEKLASSGLFSVLYHHDGVWIFRVKP
jgi:hypothetical protein